LISATIVFLPQNWIDHLPAKKPLRNDLRGTLTRSAPITSGYTPVTPHSSRSRTLLLARDTADCLFLMNFAVPEHLAADLLHRVTEADREQWLPAILQHVNHALCGILEKNVSTVGEEVVLGAGTDGFNEALAQLTLKESDDFADTLQAEAATAEFTDDGNLGNVVEGIEPPVSFPCGNNDLALIPPLQLPGCNARQHHDFLGCERRLHDPNLPVPYTFEMKTFFLENV
jgi:hypothetical protein